ncbi:PD-(D/E)XK nuclease family protein [Hymenobacter sp. 5516J-16]|uniref:PDDEXK-like family protein n=1 Tax=Hymenobacter sp. 5516J-16 TaxID=2932253 RepID=UPI001FD0F48B|nr:PD-(D/E)XK nuclease family protein [Hymenobacter sp. 5516J-16]UOQ76549.1 PD-(D/E)XK nuclease family protein [Hymenobacter sp. 5516J-16]
MHELQALLSELQILFNKAKTVDETDVFNIFRLLRKESDEVNLHSRFLAELLDPHGTHGCGNTFLRLFLEQCGIKPTEFHIDTARMLRESNRIDILLHTNQEAVIIENKIWAGDQDKQLERYADIISGRRLRYRILYLTPHGHEPSQQSVGKLADRADFRELITCISYADHIQPWIQACIKEAALHLPLRETLVQYISLIKSITGNTMSEAEKQSVLALMKSGDNILNAHVLVRNWNHVRWHTEWDFWEDLAKVVEADGYIISSERRYTDELISRVVHYSRNRNPWYGIGLPLPTSEFTGGPLKLLIERGDSRMYYGIVIPVADETVKKQIYDAVKKATEHLHCGSSPGWPIWVHTRRNIDFEGFHHEDTLQLANPAVRQETIRELWQDVQAFLQQLNEDFAQAEIVPAVST